MNFATLKTNQLKPDALTQPWIWDGYLAPGQITLFTSVWKSGKTTLLAHLLGQRRGGGSLAGRAVAMGPSVVVSEETKERWHDRHVQLGFGPDDHFICQPFVALPTPVEWQALIDFLARLAQTDKVNLAVIDPLAFFLPAGAESNAQLLVSAFAGLHRLAQAGMAVLLLHHPRKAPAAEGMAARGCGALSAAVDFIIEMRRPTHPEANDRQRRLLAFSRDPATPRSALIEINPNGLGFQCIEEPAPPDEFVENWHILRIVLEDAKSELTRQQILEQWPSTYPFPKATTLWKWLREADKRGLIVSQGTGRRSEPFRYYLPEKLEAWKADPIYQIVQASRDGVKKLAAMGLDMDAG